MNTKKSLQELTIKDGFMFFALMMYHPKFRGIRLDVIAVEEGIERKFNVEMQAEKKDSLARCSRYYHSQIDMKALTKGANYDELKDTYVIFICDFDPFGDGLYRYSYEMKCVENDRYLTDGTHTVFLNSKGYVESQDVSDRLISFLRYVANPVDGANMEDDFVSRIEQRVQAIRLDREWEVQYMLLRETLREERAEGQAEGELKVWIRLILGKMRKNKSLDSIMVELDDSSETVKNIYDIIKDMGMPDDVEAIYQVLREDKSVC